MDKPLSFKNGLCFNIVWHRRAKGFSQKAFAEALNIPVSTLSNYENGHRRPSIKTLAAMASVLGVDLQQLVPNQKYLEKDTNPIFEYIIDNCKKLNEEGQEKVYEYSGDLVASGKYLSIDDEDTE